MPDDAPTTRRIALLGSTGSIGTQTLACVEHLNRLHEAGAHPVRYEIVALAAGSDAATLCAQARRFNVPHLALADTTTPTKTQPDPPPGATLDRGPDAAERLIRAHAAGIDLVVAAIVGIAGLPSTLAAAELGIDIALANKESLVAAGALVTAAAERGGAALLPVDSEHAALWHCVMAFAGPAYRPPTPAPQTVGRLILTASGGPFRDAAAWPADRLAAITPADALAHPTWDMGPKVTIDSASLMNKALELIEAHWLFRLPASRLDAIVHPQSVVHSMAEGTDGSIVAQLGPTDMRAPIQQALTFPARPAPAAGRLDLATLARLDFEPPDESRFGALRLAKRVIDASGSAGAVFNAANEVAATAFLAGDIPFTAITPAVEQTLDAIRPTPVRTLADVLDADAAAREHARSALAV